ncbi:hypothetical protein D9M70_486820 [compost metagenome]
MSVTIRTSMRYVHPFMVTCCIRDPRWLTISVRGPLTPAKTLLPSMGLTTAISGRSMALPEKSFGHSCLRSNGPMCSASMTILPSQEIGIPISLTAMSW